MDRKGRSATELYEAYAAAHGRKVAAIARGDGPAAAAAGEVAADLLDDLRSLAVDITSAGATPVGR